MERRGFFKKAVAAFGVLVVTSEWFHVKGNVCHMPYKRHIARVSLFTNANWDPTKRVPLDWPVFAIAGTDNEGRGPVIMNFPDLTLNENDFYFRICTAIDIREELSIGVWLPESHTQIGCFDIKYAHPFQPFEIRLPRKYIHEIMRQGLALKMHEGNNEGWFISSGKDSVAFGLQPQILSGRYPGKADQLLASLCSMNSLSPFGWLGGCVHDALLELSLRGSLEAKRTLEKQLAFFLDNANGVNFEDPHTRPVVGRFHSIEDLLPLAAIVSLYPKHPSVQLAVDYCLNISDEMDLIANSSHVTSEGCYTLAYPLVKIAISRHDKDLARLAVRQLDLRIDWLSTESVVSQSSYLREDLTRHTGFDNWGRGITWYLLGIVKTIYMLENSELSGFVDTRKAKNEFLRAVKWISKYQDETGSWSSFVDRPETLPDSTTTSGIALAMAWGIHAKWLPEEAYLPKAILARSWLRNQLTADGFLQGISQINRGGEKLQANGYRVISQFGMGLMAQLECVIACET